MFIHSEIWGRPGLDCGGFCKFCFYKNIDIANLKATGCVNCPPDEIGCDYCQGFVNRIKNKFKTLPHIIFELRKKVYQLDIWGAINEPNPKMVVTSGADILYYPHLHQLVSFIKEHEFHLHLSYTSGKALTNGMAEKLISQGLDEVSFSVFSTDPVMRRRWMGDKNSEESLGGLKMFCYNMDVNASAIVIPGINDEEEILKTCSDLENWGIKTFSLRRFANFKDQGLIFNKKPIIDWVDSQEIGEFQEMVARISDEFSFKVLSFPFYDKQKDFPFALTRKKNRRYLPSLPAVNKEATILTSKLSAGPIRDIFSEIDEGELVNVIGLDKDIADLITNEDLRLVDKKDIKERIIIPRGALVQDRQAGQTLGAGGTPREIVRGPKLLTHPYYEGIEFTEDELLDFELKSFKLLIDKING